MLLGHGVQETLRGDQHLPVTDVPRGNRAEMPHFNTEAGGDIVRDAPLRTRTFPRQHREVQSDGTLRRIRHGRRNLHVPAHKKVLDEIHA